MAPQLSRRTFSTATLSSLLTYSVLETLIGHDVLADEVKPITATWLAELNEMGQQLKDHTLSQPQWQEHVEKLMAKADLADLLRFIDFPKLQSVVKFQDRGEKSLRPSFPRVEGLPKQLVFGHQVFAVKGSSVVPHGHDNMATAFLVMQGTFHGRHYDRLEDDDQHMLIRPTIDRSFETGGYSTISDVKDNVHWFQATSDGGFIFNIHVMGIKPGRSGRVYIDPFGEKLSDGRIRGS